MLEGVAICLTGAVGEKEWRTYKGGDLGEQQVRCREDEARCPHWGGSDAPFRMAIAAPRGIDVNWRRGGGRGPAVIKPRVERGKAKFASQRST